MTARVLVLTLVAALAAVACSGRDPIVIAHGPPAADARDERVLAITGMAEMMVEPDLAVMQFNFSSTARRMKPAHDRTRREVADFLAGLEKAGIAAEETKLGTVAYGANYSYPEHGAPRLEGYTASVRVIVETKDFGKIPLVLDAAADAGIVADGGVTFRSTRLPELKKQVREQAVVATRDKAQQLAGGLGARLGAVKSIRESSQDLGAGGWYGREAVANAAVAQVRVPMPSPAERGDLGAYQAGAFPLQLYVEVVYLLD